MNKPYVHDCIHVFLVGGYTAISIDPDAAPVQYMTWRTDKIDQWGCFTFEFAPYLHSTFAVSVSKSLIRINDHTQGIVIESINATGNFSAIYRNLPGKPLGKFLYY